ncbi:formin-J-like [Stegodyphus dumicola]|uniref:formin-J-like n=1 Tax=Stegodyphus dumicola TaxID=202533 RepID=UPI0015AECADF|nr:formin-J-like [Stegodyphus dumicola]
MYGNRFLLNVIYFSFQVNLLDGKRSLNVNIFLKQFRSSNDEIINILKRGAHDEIGAEKLRGLLKILPESDEIELLRGYNGDRTKLGNAEKFLLQLIELPNYKLRCEGMLLKEEFASNMAFLEPAIENIISAVEELKHCQELHEVLYMLLVAGNFLNSGGYAGDAAGFKMMSLLKVAETRANKPGMNLIHYVAQEAEKKFPNLLEFPDFLSNLEEASKLSIDNLKTEIANLSSKVSKISQQVSLAGEDVKMQMEEFLQFATRETMAVQKEIDSLEKVREDMAEFLCEDLQSFKLEECFKIFQSFCQKFKSAIEENEKRGQQEKRAEARRKQREEQLALKKKNSSENRPSSFSGSESDNIIDMLLGDIRGGFNRFGANGSFKSARTTAKPKRTSADGTAIPGELSRMNSLTSSVPSEEDATASPRIIRRRIGSSNSIANGSGGDVDNIDTQSPDVTPNGTLHRRRSRLSSEDREDNLIDFLRQTAENDSLRGDKSKVPDSGSLDRSWIRRSSRRRRPEMLAAELNERERPASPNPSPLLERRSVALEAEGSKPKQWRLKIEEWLQENEKEQEREKKLREKIALERCKGKEAEHRESDSSSKILDNSNEWKSAKNLETLHEVKTDSELYANKIKETMANGNIAQSSETLEGIPLKDKSKWRKSNLNVANSSESIDDERRRNRSRKTVSDPEVDDTISFYIRSTESVDVENSNSNASKDKITTINDAYVKKPLSLSGSSRSLESDNFKADQQKYKERPPTLSNFDESSKKLNSQTENLKTSDKTKQMHFPALDNVQNNALEKNETGVSIGRSRFYQSARELPLNKAEKTLSKSEVTDDLALEQKEINKPKKIYSTDFSEKSVTNEESKTSSPEIDNEGNFDRFSFMRKTTRRTKSRPKIIESDFKKSEEHLDNTQQCNKISEIEKEAEHSQFSQIQLVKKSDYEAKRIEDASQGSSPSLKDIGKLNSEKNRNHINTLTKNITENVKIAENADDQKKRDKSTSLKARLSKRLLSLTENLKAVSKPSESTEINASVTLGPKSAVEDKKFHLMEDSPCPRIEKALSERRASLKEEKPNPIMEHREKVLSRPRHDMLQIPLRSKLPQTTEDCPPLVIAKPKLLKESYIADSNNIKIVHATPLNHDVKAFEAYPAQNKSKEEPEKDEGFEETQSQLSEVASQEAGSNYDTDLADSPRSVRQTKDLNQKDAHHLVQTTAKPEIPSLEHYPKLDKNTTDDIKLTEHKLSTNTLKREVDEKKQPASRLFTASKPSSITRGREPRTSPSTSKKIAPVKSIADKENAKQASQAAKSSVQNRSSIIRSRNPSNIRSNLRTSRDSVSSASSRTGKSPSLRGSQASLNEASPKIGRRVAAYTKAIKSMTNNLRGTSNKQVENYDVTQSMPPTPSEENKSFISGLNLSENAKKTRSNSSVYSPRSQSRRSSEKSLNISLGTSSRRGSDKSLSRRSSERSLDLSRKSSEISIVTVKNVNRRGSASLTGRSKPMSTISRLTETRVRPSRPKSPIQPRPLRASTPINKQVLRSNSSAKAMPSSIKPSLIDRRRSIDKSSCGFMKATSASSAKSSPSKYIQEQSMQKLQAKAIALGKVEPSLNRVKQRY